MNHTILIGFVGKNPEERVTKNGNKGIFFSLAVETYFQKEKKTQWYNILIWEESLFPMALSIKKGSLISVVGTLLPPKTYESKTGETRVDMSLKCSGLYFVPGAQRAEKEEESADDDIGSLF